MFEISTLKIKIKFQLTNKYHNLISKNNNFNKLLLYFQPILFLLALKMSFKPTPNLFKKLSCLLICCLFVFINAAATIQDSITTKNVDSIIISDFILDQPLLEQETTEATDIQDQTPGILSSSLNPLYSFIQSKSFVYGLKYNGFPTIYNVLNFKNINLQSLENKFLLITGIYDFLFNFNKQQNNSFNQFNEYGLGSVGITSFFDINILSKNPSLNTYIQISNRNYQYLYGVDYLRKKTKKNANLFQSTKLKFAEPGSILNGFLEQINNMFVWQRQKNIQQELLFINLFNFAKKSNRTAITQEIASIADNNYYNPNWGFDAGELRFVNTQQVFENSMIFNYKWNGKNQTHINTTVFYLFKNAQNQSLDWQATADPKADYYKNLPSNQKDSITTSLVEQLFLNQPQLLYLNWQKIRKINSQNNRTITDLDGNFLVSGNFSNYILRNSQLNQHSFQCASTYNSAFWKIVQFQSTLRYQFEYNHHFQTVGDLLGGDYYVNWNFFGEDNNNLLGKQFDLNQPDKILYNNDVYGPNYALFSNEVQLQWHSKISLNKFDILVGTTHQFHVFQRIGFNKIGLFPTKSFGASQWNDLNSHSAHVGVLYKLSSYLQINTNAFWSKVEPPLNQYFYDVAWQEAVVHNFQQPQFYGGLIEGNYKRNAWQIYGSFFYHTSTNETIKSIFYHDEYNALVIGVLGDVEKEYVGGNVSFLYNINEQWSLRTAFTLGQFIYTKNPRYELYLKNTVYLLEQGLSYLKDLPVENNPQQSFQTQIISTPNRLWRLSLTGSFAQQRWISYNSYRRSNQVLKTVPTNSTIFKEIVEPQMIPLNYQIDLSVLYKIRLKINSRLYHNINIYTAIYNLTNNQEIISLGYEQSRFNYSTNNPKTFAPKFIYAQGLSFILSFQYIFN